MTEPFDSTIVVTVRDGTDGTDLTSPGDITIGYVDVGISNVYVASLSVPVCQSGTSLIFQVERSYTDTDPDPDYVYYGTDYWVAESGDFYDCPAP